jgi:hypothetical protein
MALPDSAARNSPQVLQESTAALLRFTSRCPDYRSATSWRLAKVSRAIEPLAKSDDISCSRPTIIGYSRLVTNAPKRANVNDQPVVSDEALSCAKRNRYHGAEP